jgi:hypothetical protein
METNGTVEVDGYDVNVDINKEDWYKLSSDRAISLPIHDSSNSFSELFKELTANKQGYSYKYTIIGNHIYRRSLFDKIR